MMNGEGVRISKACLNARRTSLARVHVQVSGCAMPEPVPVGLNERELLWKKHEAVLDKARAFRQRTCPLWELPVGGRSAPRETAAWATQGMKG